jgi:hypothetical protein
MINTIVALSLGVDNYFSRLLPLSIFHPVPMMSFIALIFLFLRFKTFNFKDPFYNLFFILIAYSFLMGISRYYLFYHEHDFLIMPIFRQLAAMILGLITLMAFREIFKKTQFEKMSSAVVICSIPFLLLGIYQHTTGHTIGVYTRVQSLFMEPSYFGDYLILILAPCLFYQLEKFIHLSRSFKMLYLIIIILWLSNVYFIQSGTAILKLVSLVGFTVFFYPVSLKKKFSGLISAFLFVGITIFATKGYLYFLFQYVLQIVEDPNAFFKIHNFYDRFFPLYASLNSLISLKGFLGLGFGGDYFEFTNLYPQSTHAEMLSHKSETLSFFNAFAPKIILYSGILGVMWLFLLIRTGFKTQNLFIKIALLNVILSSYWGIPNFSLPYLWFWLALALTPFSSVSDSNPETPIKS